MTGYYLPEGLPAPAPTDLDAPFWAAARRHELAVQRCDACGHLQFPPEEICRACHAFDPGWAPVAPRGTLFSWTRIWHPVHPALANTPPYLAIVVRLDEAPHIRLVGNLIDFPDGDPPMDAPVEAAFEDHDGYTLIQWRLRRRIAGGT
jgi:uncharacterized OB-fold protein